MNDNDPILAELKKISAWADIQRKITKWSFIAGGVFIILAIAFIFFMEHQMKTRFDEATLPRKPDPPTWADVDWNIRRANVDEAIKIGEELIKKMPQYADGHRRLGLAYLAAGKLEQAKDQFTEACRLLPSEENEDTLFAIQKRIKLENPQ